MKLLGVVLAVGGLVLSVLWSGYVFSILWAWFVVPQFEGAPVLSVAAAIGMSMTVSFLTYHHDDRIEDQRSTSERVISMISMAIGRPLFVLIIAAIVRAFI
jgi:hypothetical protein